MRNLNMVKALCVIALVFAGVSCTDSKPSKWAKSNQDKASSGSEKPENSHFPENAEGTTDEPETVEQKPLLDDIDAQTAGIETGGKVDGSLEPESELEADQGDKPVLKNPMIELMNKNVTEALEKGEIVRKFRSMNVFLNSNRIEIQGVIAITHGVIELFACAPGGKDHESVCVLDVDPEDLMLALMLIGKRPTPSITSFEEATEIKGGDRVVIHVEWDQTRKGVKQHVKRRAEDLLYNVYTRTSMKHAGWVFTGSITVRHPQTEELVLVAKYKRNLIVTLHDPDAILDTPLLEGGYDTTYVANGKNLPISRTPVLLSITSE